MMNWQAFPLSLQANFEQAPEVLRGKLRLRGTRVSVEQVLELLEGGVTPTEIVSSYPSLTINDVAAVERLAELWPEDPLTLIGALTRLR